jgi:GT2 family glycosyltransferase
MGVSSATPRLSLVIPTLGGVGTLDRLLASIDVAAQRCASTVEVIVSSARDHPSHPQVVDVATKRGARVVAATRGVGRQRNEGARAAGGSTLLFIDDDCWADPDLLAVLETAFDEPGVGAVAGQVRFSGRRGRVFRASQATGITDAFTGFGATVARDVRWGVTANLAVRRAVFEEVGGLDETFPSTPGGEDVDLGLRIIAAGHRVRYRPDIVVHHPTGPWDRAAPALRRMWNYGRGDVALIERHRDLRAVAGPGLAQLVPLLAVLSAIRLAVGGGLLWAFVPALYVAFAVALSALSTRHRGLRGMGDNAIATLLLAVLDAGRMSAALRRKRWRLVGATVLLDPGQQRREWPATVRAWVVSLSSLVLVWLVV